MADPNARPDDDDEDDPCYTIFAVLFVLAVFLIIPVLMLVFGIKNDVLMCESTTCRESECTYYESNRPLQLGVPSIGITVSQALIVGGCIGILCAIFVLLYILNSCTKSDELRKEPKATGQQQPSGTQPTMTITRQQSKMRIFISNVACGFLVLLFLAAFCWMGISFAVYSQYNEMCSDYNRKFSIVPSSSMKLLVASNIIGIIVGFGFVCKIILAMFKCREFENECSKCAYQCEECCCRQETPV